MKPQQRVAIIGGTRIPFVKSFTHYQNHTNSDLMTAALQGLVDKFNLKGKKLGEVALGAVIKHPKDFNLSRECVLNVGLDPHTPGFDVQRACGTSLTAAIGIANKIALGQIEVGIAGGTDTNSDAPLTFKKQAQQAFLALSQARSLAARLSALKRFRPGLFVPNIPSVNEPRTGLRMGDHCELMAKEWKISRAAQDELALQSHQRTVQAYQEGFYHDLVAPFGGLDKDPLPRADTSLEKLARLKPAFDPESGTLSAGNSTPLSDGASAVLMGSEDYAKKHGLPILAYFVDGQSAAVDYVGGEGLLMAPTYAVAELLRRRGLALQDFDFYEIHEAFSAQLLCTLKAWESAAYCQQYLGEKRPLGRIDNAKLNVKGGSVAIGHPFAATGTRLVASLAKLLSDKPGAKGLISACTAGGMGVATILEAP
ncbi:MAG: acetyl-CoA C-acetyltransferase [Bdellovibrionales bacterium]|nr:acetyl-CoA C-acetyltransferase [Bdellovibrionales bacterium]